MRTIFLSSKVCKNLSEKLRRKLRREGIKYHERYVASVLNDIRKFEPSLEKLFLEEVEDAVIKTRRGV